MWWLKRSELHNRFRGDAHQLGTYPYTASHWIRDVIREKKKKRRGVGFRLRPLKKPDTEPLRPDLKTPSPEEKCKVDYGKVIRFEIPDNWQERVTHSHTLEKPIHEEMIISFEKIPEEEKRMTNEERDKILAQQEGYVPRRKQRWKDVLASLERKKSSIDENTPDWITRSITRKPPGRSEGLKAPFSEFGDRLTKKSRALHLWHEDLCPSGGRPATGVILHSLVARLEPLPLETDMVKPISSFIRVPVPEKAHAPHRTFPEEQVNELEKGGHAKARDDIADYKILLDSTRKKQDPNAVEDEARMLLCLGILYDNAEKYDKALESYEEYVCICKQIGDLSGEAMAYNFMGCSVQAQQDKKFRNSKAGFELSTPAIIEYERALNYHEKHASITDLQGKFIAYTNKGLLLSAIESWTDAAHNHRKALKCATYLKRPEYQNVAVGNLGFLFFRRRKFGASKLCIKRYLQICKALEYKPGEARAHYLLGQIASELRKYSEALDELRACIEASKLLKDQNLENMARVLIGAVKGNAHVANMKSC